MSLVLNGTSGVTTNSGTLISASTIGVGGTAPAASGAGISFPASQSASSDANTLDDYEEGTWTPQIYYQNATDQANAVNVVQNGYYTKVGNLVTVNFYLQFTGPSTPAADNIGVKNLPFVSANISNNTSTGSPLMLGSGLPSGGYSFLMTPNSSFAVLLSQPYGGNLGASVGTGTRYFRGLFTYQTA